MMSLCKKSVHSILGYYNSKDNRFSPDFSRHTHHFPDIYPPANMVDSAAIKKPLPPPTVATSKLLMCATASAEQPSPTITTTTTRNIGQDFSVLPRPRIITTTTKSDPGGTQYNQPPPPSPPQASPTIVVAATTKGDGGEIDDKAPPSPPQASPTIVVAATTKGDAGEIGDKTPPHGATTTSDIQALITKRDPGSVGFIGRLGGSVDGFRTCTESLGFESMDERVVVDIDQLFDTSELPPPLMLSSSKPKKTIPLENKVKNYPPPLSSLRNNGLPKFFLRPVRNNGRLELITEVKTGPFEFLQVSRQDGRLRLQIISEIYDTEENAEYEEEGDTEENPLVQLEKEENFGELEEEKYWNIPATVSGGDGFRRCYEPVTSHQRRHSHSRSQNHHHHQQQNEWSQQRCVTIR